MVHKLLEQTLLLVRADDAVRRWSRVVQGHLLDADRCSWNCVGTLLRVLVIVAICLNRVGMFED